MKKLSKAEMKKLTGGELTPVPLCGAPCTYLTAGNQVGQSVCVINFRPTASFPIPRCICQASGKPC